MNLRRLFLTTTSVFIVSLPLYPIRWSYFGKFPTTLLEAIFFIFFLIWGIDKLRSHSLTIPKTRFDFWAILFILAGIIGIAISPDKIASLGRFRAFFVEPIIVYYILIDIYQRYFSNQSHTLFFQKFQPNFSKTILGLLFILGLWTATLGILQYFFHLWIFTPDQANRAHALYNIGNQLALVLGPIILIAFALLFQKNASRFLIIYLLVLLIAFYATKSEGGYISLIIGFIFVFISNYTKIRRFNRLLQLIIIGSTLGFILFLTQINNFVPKVSNPWIRPGGTDLVRLCLWQGAFNAIKDHPIMGIGLAGFSQVYGTNYYTCDGEPFEDADNIILNFWTKTGLLGLIALIGMLIIIFEQKQRFIYQIPFFYWFIHGMVDVPYFKNDLSFLWWIFTAILVIKELEKKSISQVS